MAYTNANATPRADVHALMMQGNADFTKLCIAEQVFPVYGSDVKRGQYMTALLANAEILNGNVTPRSPGTAYNRGNRKFNYANFDCQEYGDEEIVDDSYAAEVERFLQLEVTLAMLLEKKFRIAYEKRVSDALMTTASGAVATAATVAYTTANILTMDPVSDVDLAKTRMMKNGVIPNACVMSLDVYNRIRRSALLQNQVYGVVPKAAGQKMLPGENDVAQALGVDTLLVGKAPINANAKGQTYSGSLVWPTTYVAVCNIQGGDFLAGGCGRTIQWTADTTGLFTPETYRDNSIRSDVIRVRQHTQEVIIDPTSVELITTSYA